MLGAERDTAEEFYGRLQATVRTLDVAARRHASAAETVPAIAAALGSDVASIQVALWERLVIASRAPQRMYFQAAASLVSGLQSAADDVAGMEGTAEQALAAFRLRMTADFAPALKADIQTRWASLAYLAGLAAPTQQLIEAFVADVLEGHTPSHYIAAKQQAAHEDILVAQSFRIRSDTAKAIEAAYSSDFHLLQAYLVESALAAGDQRLLTVSSRRDLVDAAIAELPGLPNDFSGGVELLRLTMCAALNMADADRLRPRFKPV